MPTSIRTTSEMETTEPETTELETTEPEPDLELIEATVNEIREHPKGSTTGNKRKLIAAIVQSKNVASMQYFNKL